MGKFYAELSEELSLYVRQLAWLSATPASDRKNLSTANAEPVSRIKKLEDEGKHVPLPPISAEWLVDLLMEIGPVDPIGMGVGPISWLTLEAWQHQSGRPLQPWEGRLLRDLSKAFADQSEKSKQHDCPAPWSDQVVNRASVAQRLMAALSGFGKR